MKTLSSLESLQESAFRIAFAFSRERIAPHPSFFLGAHELGVGQELQVVGDGRLLHVQLFGDLGDAQGLALEQGEDLVTTFIARELITVDAHSRLHTYMSID